jgi:hypothetical protein
MHIFGPTFMEIDKNWTSEHHLELFGCDSTNIDSFFNFTAV